MVIVSHDREFLDQLCTKIVETERGVALTYKGNYTQYLAAKEERIAQQWSAYEKQQKETARLVRPPSSSFSVLADGFERSATNEGHQNCCVGRGKQLLKGRRVT